MVCEMREYIGNGAVGGAVAKNERGLGECVC